MRKSREFFFDKLYWPDRKLIPNGISGSSFQNFPTKKKKYGVYENPNI